MKKTLAPRKNWHKLTRCLAFVICLTLICAMIVPLTVLASGGATTTYTVTASVASGYSGGTITQGAGSNA